MPIRIQEEETTENERHLPQGHSVPVDALERPDRHGKRIEEQQDKGCREKNPVAGNPGGDEKEEQARKDVEEGFRRQERNAQKGREGQDHRSEAALDQRVLVVGSQPVSAQQGIGGVHEPQVVPRGLGESGRKPRRHRKTGDDEKRHQQQERLRANRFPVPRGGIPEQSPRTGERKPEKQRHEHGAQGRECVDPDFRPDADWFAEDGVGVDALGLDVDCAARPDVEPPDVVPDSEIAPVQCAGFRPLYDDGTGADGSRSGPEIEPKPFKSGDRQRNGGLDFARLYGNVNGLVRGKGRVRPVRVENLARDGHGRLEADGDDDFAHEPRPVADAKERGDHQERDENGAESVHFRSIPSAFLMLVSAASAACG